MKKLYTILVLAIALVAMNFEAMAQDFFINPGGQVTVLNGSSIHVVNGQLIINSPTNSGAPGSLINKNDAGGQITASNDVVFNRFLSKDKYHMVTSPVADFAIVPGLVNGVNNKNVYVYDESTATWVKTLVGTMEENKGYFTFDNVYKTVHYTGALYSSAPIIVEDASFTYAANLQYKGINVIGNKYTSAIDLNQVSGTNISNTFYIYYTNGYATYNNVTGVFSNGGSRYVAATQGISYQVTDAVNSITIPHSAKVHNTVIFLKSEEKSKKESNLLNLSVSGNEMSSEMIVHFSDLENTTESFDASYDALKLFSPVNEMPEIYSITNDNIKSVVDYLPESVMENYKRVMGFKVETAGTYTISVNELNFDSNFPVYLEDTYTAQTIKLTPSTTYAFTSDKGDFTGRFNLHFNPLATTDIDNLADGSAINVFSFEKQIQINLNASDLSNSKVEVYNLLGKKIMEQELVSNQTILNLDVATGNYLVKVVSGIDTQTSKVFIQ